MFFSIIVPVYNVEKYLKECIDSILNQKFKNFELILVNDGSTDCSGNICDEYSKNDIRVRVIHTSNKGQSEARNVGVSKATGKYIIFIDSDDYINNNNFLELIYQKCIKDVDVVLYKFQKYYEIEEKLEKCNFNFPVNADCSDVAKTIKNLVSTDSFYCAPWTKCIRKKLLEENRIKFESGLLGEDQDWYYKVVIAANKIEFIDEPFIIYRQRSGSLTSSWKMKNLTDCIYIIEKWSNYFSSSELNDELKYGLNSSLAKLYCNMLIAYCRFKDKGKVLQKQRIKDLNYLFKYNCNRRVYIMSKIYKVCGFEGLMLSLKLIESIRRR